MTTYGATIEDATKPAGAQAPPASVIPTFTHAFRWAQLPSGNFVVYDVPVFAAIGEEGLKDGRYSRAWMDEAFRRALERKATGYLSPIHVGHHDEKGCATPLNRPAGFMDPKRIADTEIVTSKGRETLPAYFIDMVEVPPSIFADIRALRFPFRSLESAGQGVIPDFSSLALLDTETPFWRLPVLKVDDADAVARFSFRCVGGLMSEKSEKKTDASAQSATPTPTPEAPATPAPTAPAQFADASAPAQPMAPAAEKPAAPEAPKASGINVHAKTILKSVLAQINALLSEEEPEDPTKPEEETPMAGTQTPKSGAAPAAVPNVPSGSFSEAGLDEIARLTAENMALKAGVGAKSDADRVSGAIAAFRASGQLCDETEFRSTVTRLKLAGDQIDAFAASLGKHLPKAPPRPGEAHPADPAPAGQFRAAQSAGEDTAFLLGDPELKKFAEQPTRLHRFAAQAAADFDASPVLRANFSAGRADYVNAVISGKRRELGIK